MQNETNNYGRTPIFACLVLSLSLVGCQSLKKAPGRDTDVRKGRSEVTRTTPTPPPVAPPAVEVGETTPSQVVPPPASEPPTEEAPIKPVHEKPRIALILGPGGARAFAHAGVLQEIHRSQLPIQFIGGLEMGALAAAAYANKPQAFEAEWQMMKLKDEDLSSRGIMGGKQPVDLKDWRGYLAGIFGSSRVEDARLPFACLTYQYEKQQILILNKGTFAQSLPYCLSYPPFFKMYESHHAAASHLGVLAKYLRQKGATHVIYVDLLGDRGRMLPGFGDDNNALVWNLTQSHLYSQWNWADDVLRIPVTDDVTAFNRRRDIVKQARDATKKALAPILKKYGIE